MWHCLVEGAVATFQRIIAFSSSGSRHEFFLELSEPEGEGVAVL